MIAKADLCTKGFPEKRKKNLSVNVTRALSEKKFVECTSPLIEKYGTSGDIKAVYNIFVVIFIGLVINTTVQGYLQTGQRNFGYKLMVQAFNKLHIVFLIWIAYNITAHIMYFSFILWAKIRIHSTPKLDNFWDRLGISIITVYYFISLYGIEKIIDVFDLEPGSAAILGIEQVRILMKQHSFLRTNIPKVLSYKPHSEQAIQLPKLGSFSYFLLAPTLIYKDAYPRTKNIRWTFVVVNLAELFGVIIFLAVVTEHYLIVPHKDICLRKYSTSELLVPLLTNWFPGIIYVLCVFYTVLHLAQNAFAEVLRFADRGFYKEWWTCRSFSEYHKQWNVIVQDWLYKFVYQDVVRFFPTHKMAAQLVVFALSIAVHEWLLITTLRLFLPVNVVQFFIAGPLLSALNLLQAPIGNFLFWFLLIVGSGFQLNAFTLEFRARLNCPLENDSGWDFYKPRFLTCDCYS